MLSITDRISRRLFRQPRLGIPAARTAHRMRMDNLSRYISRWSRWAPDVVGFELACGEDLIRGQMYSANATDQIVGQIWTKGAESYEAPLPALFTALTRERLWRRSRAMTGRVSGSQGSPPERGHVLVVGANTGFYALLAGLGSGARVVHAFEPYPPAFKWLRANAQLNGLQGKVTLVDAAIGNTNGETNLFVPPPRFGEVLETSSSINAEYHKDVWQHFRVPVLTVDEYARREGGCGTASVSTMLLDMEGFEHAALEGSADVLQYSRPVVVFEVLKRLTTHAAALERIRQDYGYRCFVLRSDELTISEPILPWEKYSNQLMVPEEQLDALIEAAAWAGLKCNRDA